MRERESLFNEFIVEVRRREKDEKQLKKEQVSAERIQVSESENLTLKTVMRLLFTPNNIRQMFSS